MKVEKGGLQEATKKAIPEGYDPSKYVLGGTHIDTDIKVLAERFDKIAKDITDKEYLIGFTTDQLTFIDSYIVPGIEWIGAQVFDILEIKNLISNESGVEKVGSKEPAIRAFLHALLQSKQKGLYNALTFKEILIKISETINIINTEQQTLRDAGSEFLAAEQGIFVEEMTKEKAEQLLAESQLQ